MKSAPIRYGTRFGCRFGQPHDFVQLHAGKSYTVERCRLCGVRKRWNTGFKGRISNTEYLRDHVRQYAQSFGSTKRVYMKLYKPENCIIRI